MTAALRHWYRVLLALAAIALCTGLTSQPLMAKTVYVGTCVSGPNTFATIQAAVNDLAATTIKVCPGNYPEQVTINHNLTLTGYNNGTSENPVLVVPGSGFVGNTTSLTTGNPIAAQILVEYPATDVTISYLAVDGSGSNLNDGCYDPPLIGVYFKGASGTVNYVAARSQAQNATYFGCAASAGLGMFVESSPSYSSAVTIKNSTIRGYQKNGITANESGTTVTLNGNAVVGAGPAVIAQNGIQVAFGATGTLQNNTISDDDYSGDTTEAIGTGILVYGSGGLSIAGNTVTNTQTGIVTATAGSMTADGNTLNNNSVSDTHVYDGIDLCSNSNIVTNNSVFSSDEAGIHLDSECGPTGNNDTVSRNVVNEACAAILLGSGAGNTLTGGTVANVANTTLAGDVCPAIVPDALVRSQAASRGRNYVPARP